MAFDWMKPAPRPRRRSDDADRRLDMYEGELRDRAQLLCRLGFPPSKTLARLEANVGWDFTCGAGKRPPRLGSKAVAEIVKSAYLRRASR